MQNLKHMRTKKKIHFFLQLGCDYMSFNSRRKRKGFNLHYRVIDYHVQAGLKATPLGHVR